jgi:hypothetical protein
VLARGRFRLATALTRSCGSANSNCAGLQARKQFEGESVVVRFARCSSQTDWQSVGIDQRVNLAGQSASRPAYRLFLTASDAGGVLMDADNGRVGHLHGGVAYRSSGLGA